MASRSKGKKLLIRDLQFHYSPLVKGLPIPIAARQSTVLLRTQFQIGAAKTNVS